MTENKQKLKRVIMEIPLSLAQEIKILSARRNCTMKRWLMRAIVEYIQKERQYDKAEHEK